MGKEPLIVTDHFVLRFLERFEGVDIEAARMRIQEMLAHGRTSELIDFADRAAFKLRSGGSVFCGRNGRLTTCWRSDASAKDRR